LLSAKLVHLPEVEVAVKMEHNESIEITRENRTQDFGSNAAQDDTI
jgi:hypothetical protein